MRILAQAKINLWLSVGPRRPDGHHEILSVMQSISLADELEMAPAAETTLEVEPPGAAPEDASNLVSRAARAMMAATGASGGAAMRLRKRVPVAAGLAGGSADGAAALVGLNELWGAGLSRKALERMGASLGADVPFCVRGGTAIARGTGTELAPAACREPLWWVLGSNGSSLSTADVYAECDRLGIGGALEDPYPLVDALARGDVLAVAGNLRNDLTPAAESLMPRIADAGAALREAGGIGVVLSGSGPAVCALARDEDHAREIAAVVAGDLAWLEVAHSLEHGARIVER